MTIFGWDASHYDGDLTTDVLVRAKAEGIEFFTHKIGEGLTNTDTTAKQALTAARDAGIRVIGAYYFIHSGDMLAQAARFIALADSMVPWWRTFPGWFWQTDAETDAGGNLPTAAEVKIFSDAVERESGKTVVVYASHGQYGNRLTGLGHLLWNANYPTEKTGPFKLLYPGDKYAGFNPYSGQTPAIAQYTSKSTIAGRTTCDANAFPGTIDELFALITGGTDMSLTPDDIAKVVSGVWHAAGTTGKPDTSAGSDLGGGANAARSGWEQSKTNGSSLSSLGTRLDGVDSKLNAILLALQNMGSGGVPAVVTISDADVQRIAVADADETARRQQS